jgi:hypothetical protein
MDNINEELTAQMAGIKCRHCEGGPIEIQNRFEVKNVGDYSLAGVQMKFSGGYWPWAICTNCGHESRGEVA